MKVTALVLLTLVLLTACPFKKEGNTVLRGTFTGNDSSQYVITFYDDSTYTIKVKDHRQLAEGVYGRIDTLITLHTNTPFKTPYLVLRNSMSVLEYDDVPSIDTIRKTILYQSDSIGNILFDDMYFEMEGLKP